MRRGMARRQGVLNTLRAIESGDTVELSWCPSSTLAKYEAEAQVSMDQHLGRRSGDPADWDRDPLLALIAVRRSPYNYARLSAETRRKDDEYIAFWAVHAWPWAYGFVPVEVLAADTRDIEGLAISGLMRTHFPVHA